MRWEGMYISGTGTHLPSGVPLAEELRAGRYDEAEAARTQMIEFARSDDGLSSLEYGAKAGRAALDATPADIRAELRSLFHAFVGPPGGPPAWNPPSKIHELLGLDFDVIPFGVTNGCAVGLAQIERACLELNGDPTGRPGAALVVASEVWPPEIVNPLKATRGLVLADGAGAAVVSNIDGMAEILATRSRIDSRLADATRGAESLRFDPSARVDLGARFDHFAAHGIDHKTYRKMRDELILTVVDDVLRHADVRLRDIDVFLFTHSGKHNLDNGYLRLFPEAKQKTNTVGFGLRIGHVGPADWFISLDRFLDAGVLRSGDVVLQLGGAGGWLESAVVLRVR